MKHTHKIAVLTAKLRSFPKWYYFAAVMLVVVVWYCGVFVLRQSVTFAYSGESCVARLTLFPSLHRSPSNATFDVKLKGGIAGVYTTHACVQPIAHPETGKRYAAVAPFGGWIFRQQFAIEVPKPPIANTKVLTKPLSTTRALTIPLDQADETFTYMLGVAGKQAKCSSIKQGLKCNVETLKLTQGKQYPVELKRAFGSAEKTLTKQTVTTLPAVTLKDSSVKPNEVVYAKPREFTLQMDKALAGAAAELIKVEGDTRTEHDAKITVEDTTVRIATSEELSRDTQFEIHLTKADAKDGSGLDGELVVPFRISGGPKPVDVSARGQSVPLNATAIITFDQEISQSQDLGKFVQVTGAPAQITRTANQLHITLQQAPKCADVTISIAKGFVSKYDTATKDDWKHSFRTTCYTTSVIGYSVRGRTIQAYHFGNGPEAILFVGGIHGNEQSSSLILHDLIKDLDVNARTIPPSRQVVVVPTLNPDGYASNARNNARNVNLNRNFATNDWQTDLRDTNGEVKGGGGPQPMSEPETRAIAALSAQLRPRFVFSYHAVGSVVIGNEAGDSASRANAYASMVGYRNGTGMSGEIFDYAISGTYDDWLAQKLGVSSMIVELGSYTYRDYSHHKQAMWSVIKN